MAETKPTSTADVHHDKAPREQFVGKPTPTQEENDRAAIGEHVMNKEPDGSPEEPNPAMQGDTARRLREKQEHEEKEKRDEPSRNQGREGRSGSSSYPTRQMTTQQTTHATPSAHTQPNKTSD